MMSLQRHNQPYMGSAYNTLGASKPHLGPPRAKSHQSINKGNIRENLPNLVRINYNSIAGQSSAHSSEQGSVMGDGSNGNQQYHERTTPGREQMSSEVHSHQNNHHEYPPKQHQQRRRTSNGSVGSREHPAVAHQARKKAHKAKRLYDDEIVIE